MSKIIRTPTCAKGGITPEEKAQMDLIAQEWINIAMRTDPIEPNKIEPAIRSLYRAADLDDSIPVVIVPSPLVMAFASGAAAWIWHRRDGATDSAIHSATDTAIHSATASATASATHNATYSATHIATRIATASATDSATRIASGDVEQDAYIACFDLAGEGGVMCARRWWDMYQGGNMWAGWASYLAACRDVLHLELPEFEKYQAWEDCARHGGFRVMHEKFCMVSDFPLRIEVDENNEPHCENGPSHEWRDGWKLYHWHGVRVPAHWIESPDTVDPSEVLKCENVEQRAAGAAIIGWPKMLDSLECKVIHDSGNDDIGQLIELTLPGLDEPGRFLKAMCPRNGLIVEGVPYTSDIDGLPIDTAIAAQAWRIGDPQSEYQHPSRRT